ncbi:MAG: tetratricopeptide repeat protein [Bacteroidales bacterium]|nr:tetratricopeptide repeat protein [Bacteroidales bacterium]
MRSRLVVISSLLLVAFALAGAALTPGGARFRSALEHFNRGMYDRARSEFEAVGKGPVAEGYAVLCAGKLNVADFPELLKCYAEEYPGSFLLPELHFQYACNLFDEARYAESLQELNLAGRRNLGRGVQAEFLFKSGYSNFVLRNYPEARECLEEHENYGVDDYTTLARYALGCMDYTEEKFLPAIEWFLKVVPDGYRAKLSKLAQFYITDSRFMLKDYAYVTNEGVDTYNSFLEGVSSLGDDDLGVLEGCRGHLARIISESYLVLGDKESARDYYEKGVSPDEDMKDSDWFYAGSVLYAVQDYEGAIEKFTRINNHRDSLWQIAAYQLGNSYIQTRDKVSALSAFKSAADLDFDESIREDASFNHAKLAFDLNNDGSWFEKYLKNYSTSRKGEQVYGYMALTRLAGGDYSGAIDAYEKIANPDEEQDMNYLKANYLRAAQLVGAGAYSDAVPFLETATLGLDRNDPFCQLSNYWLAECRYRTGDYSAAFSLFSSLYNLSALYGEPEGNMLPYNIAYSAFRKADYETAAKWFDRSLSSLDPAGRTDARIRRADCDLGRKDYEAAAVSYQKAIDEAGSQKPVYPYYQLAVCWSLLKKPEKKAQTLSAVQGFPVSSPMYADAMYELGRTWLELKEPRKALNVFRELSRASLPKTDIAKGLMGEGMANMRLDKTEEGLACYKKVVEILPGSDIARDALLAIESVYQSAGQPEKYIEYVEANGIGSGTGPEEKEKMYFSAGEQNFASGNFVQARTSLERYASLYPSGTYLHEAQYLLGESLRMQGLKMEACDAYRRAADFGKDAVYYEASLLAYAGLCLELERFDPAYEAYSTLASDTGSEERRILSYRGMMDSAYGARRYEDAIDAAELLSDGDTRTLYVTAKSLLATSQREDAMSAFTQLARQASTPEGAEANYILIQDCFDRGKFGDVQKKVYDFSPNAGAQNYWLARAFLTLGDSFAEQGNYRQARQTYESIRDGYEAESVTDEIPNMVAEKLNRLDSLEKQ